MTKAGLGQVFIKFLAELNNWIFLCPPNFYWLIDGRVQNQFKDDISGKLARRHSKEDNTRNTTNITSKHCANILNISSNISQICLFWPGFHVCGFDEAQFQRSITCRHCFCPPLSASLFSIPSKMKMVSLNICLNWNPIQYCVWCFFVKYWNELQFHILQVKWHALYWIITNQGWYCIVPSTYTCFMKNIFEMIVKQMWNIVWNSASVIWFKGFLRYFCEENIILKVKILQTPIL